MPYPQIDYNRLIVFPLESRKSKTKIEDIAIDPDTTPPDAPGIVEVVEEIAIRILKAKKLGASVMLAFGSHLVKNGAGPIIVKLMEHGWVTHLATQGAGGIHDWEFSYLGRSEEDVRANVSTGTFGTWEETGKYTNLSIQVGTVKGSGYGESLGAFIYNEGMEIPSAERLKQAIIDGLNDKGDHLEAKMDLLETIKKFNLKPGFVALAHPYKQYSIFGYAYRLKIPLTVHPGIGYDIIYNNHYSNGGALGRGGHIDYKIFVKSVMNLSHGIFLSIGSAIMAPQVFEKALSFANNLRLQEGEKIVDYYIVVNDLQPLTWDWSKSEPPKSSSDYYLRFFKSFYRMGGTIRYVSVDNRILLHNVYAKLKELTHE